MCIRDRRYVDENGDEKIKYNSIDLRFNKDNKIINVCMRKSGIIPEEYDLSLIHIYRLL